MMYWIATAWAAFPMMAPITSMMMAPTKNHQNADREARPLKVTMFPETLSGDRLAEADGPALQVAPLAGVPAVLWRLPVTACRLLRVRLVGVAHEYPPFYSPVFSGSCSGNVTDSFCDNLQQFSHAVVRTQSGCASASGWLVNRGLNIALNDRAVRTGQSRGKKALTDARGSADGAGHTPASRQPCPARAEATTPGTREGGDLMTGVTLDATDAAELAEMLQFLADWLKRDPDPPPRVAGRLRRPSRLHHQPAASVASRAAEGQLSSRTLRVSTCCWKATALPSFMVHTWTIFTTAGSPELLCFHP